MMTYYSMQLQYSFIPCLYNSDFEIKLKFKYREIINKIIEIIN